TYADEFNIGFMGPDLVKLAFDRVRDACAARGRTNEPDYSMALVTCVGTSDADVALRATAIGRDVDELKANGLAGSPAEVVDKIGAFADVGASTMYLQFFDLADIDQLELIASEVMPKL